MSLASKALMYWPTLVLLTLASLLPVYGPFMVYVEGAVLPVTTKIRVLEPVLLEDGLALNFRYSYTKLRACEYVGVEARLGADRIDFDRVPGQPVVGTRGPGRQVSAMWRLAATSLNGVEIWFIHRCSFLWLTMTKVYG